MKTKTITVYEFDELDERAKERARDWYREGALDYEWWEYTYEDAKTIGKHLGITIDDIYFSGFASQGDGACLTGSWSAYCMDLKKLWEHCPKDEEIIRIGESLANIAQCVPASNAHIKHTGHYYHEHSVSIDVNIDEDAEDPSGDYEEWFTQDEHIAYEEQIAELLRDFMQWIYKQLEAEHDYLMSDETVDESIRANEYTFTESGERED